MHRYLAIFNQYGQVANKIEYDFDGTYVEHVEFLLSSYRNYFCWDDGACVYVYRDCVQKENLSIKGWYLGECDATNPHWEFYKVTSTNPNCFDSKIKVYSTK